MSRPRVMMVGYYGHGNFGDDVLMRVTHQLVTEVLQTAEIFVLAEGANPSYIQRLLDDGIRLLAPGYHGQFEYIIHGGGGVFSDLVPHSMLQQMRERVLLIFGQRFYIWAERFARRALNKPRTNTRCRLGLGIGVGTFTAGSARMRAKLPVLADFAALWLRDAASEAALTRFQPILRAERIHGSDLAFLTTHWCPAMPVHPKHSGKPRLGIALRDWPATDYDALQQALAALAADYAITGFILDARADPKTTALFAPYGCSIWNPETMALTDFATTIAAQDVLLTSRAHGAIVAACMGVPTAIVAIEPKLEQVHGMLPQASVLVGRAPEQWSAAIARASTIPRAMIEADVARNRDASQAAWQQMQRWFA